MMPTTVAPIRLRPIPMPERWPGLRCEHCGDAATIRSISAGPVCDAIATGSCATCYSDNQKAGQS